VRLLFGDEMRYGLMSNVRRSWSAIGVRSVYLNQQEFSNRYLYTAIDPISGETFHLMDFEDAATEQSDIFLSALQEKFPNEHLVLVWDRAPFHKPKSLQRRHMTLIHLPSYSPQLNPVERFFGEMRKFTANKIFREGMEALSKTIENALLALSKSTVAIKQLTAYDWIVEQWNQIANWMIVRNFC
jgi:transposase